MQYHYVFFLMKLGVTRVRIGKKPEPAADSRPISPRELRGRAPRWSIG